MKRKVWLSGGIALAVVLQACSNGADALPAGGGAAASSMRTLAADSANVSLRNLPLDDTAYETNGPEAGHVFSCQSPFNGQGPMTDGPWIDRAAGTWNMLEKPAVEGAVRWTSQFVASSSGAQRTLAGNGLPSHVTGRFPIAASDPAYRYDQNPNSIESQRLNYSVPLNPTRAATASCANMGPVGVMLSGAQLYNALDGLGRDAAAHEVLDSCNGHPDQSGTYHYHSPSKCIADPGNGHSNLVGYALDGFGIYGVRGTDGKTLTNANLDACHGHTHAIRWNGKMVVMYHYHMTYEYPYSIGCYRGTPANTRP